jgi:hypothetical protein
MYYIYELVEGADYPALKARQRALALVTAKSKLRRNSLDFPDVICTYGCDASEEEVEAAVFAETGYKTPWIRYILKEFATKLNAGMPTFHEEASAAPPAPPAQPEFPRAPPAQAEAPVEEICR